MKAKIEKHTIKGKIVQRKVYRDKDNSAVIVEEWDIPAELEDIPFTEIVKKFKRVRRK